MTFRNAIFQTHWLLGITAGLVLALVGATGAILSFEDELLRALNPGVLSVEARDKPLAPVDLLERVRAQRPALEVQSLALSNDPEAPARVGFAPAKDAPKGPGGRARGETVNVDPYTGEVLGEPQGEGFFRTTMQLHRWLVMDDVGKQIVGFSTVVLVFFCLSGLYLRWPRRWHSLRAWFALDWRQKARNFLWHLHSIVGTWVLVAYLVMALTGLWWSYEWYRDGLNRWAGVETQKREAPRDRPTGSLERDGSTPAAAPLDVAAIWTAFQRVAPPWSTATMQWPRDGGPVQFRYLDAEPAHERANNSIELDPATLAVVKHERYDDKPVAQKIVGSMFALHRGSFFGLGGVIAFMLASVLMPLFAVTGWMLYLDRRRKQRAARVFARSASASGAIPDSRDAVLITHASQTGSAQRLAWQTAALLREGGVAARVEPLGRVQPADLADVRRVLFVVSTFGEGQPPDEARAFARRMREVPPMLPDLHYAVLALGDREYGSYCEFGRELDQWLHRAGAQALFDRVEVDALDEGALRHWQHHVGQIAGRSDLPDWSAPRYEPWRLAARDWLNPGSPGGRAFHLALVPRDPQELVWEAGDIAEIGPRHGDAEVRAWLEASGLDGNATVAVGADRVLFADLAARSRLPDPASVHGRPAQAVAASLQPLPHREYSIASLPADGSLQLLVRQMHDGLGRLGLGSGWLTEHAPVGSTIDLRIRANPSFRAPDDDRPVILVGNGTGIAGLRALLKARIAAGHTRNWLLFGERTQAHDGFYRDEIQRWIDEGAITHTDLVFSRDGGAYRYVQDALRARIEKVREWIGAGASVYVCGSLEGMAPGVDAVLRDALGEEAVDAMAADGRYRRDVY